jgi:enoyl reductase-like protein
MTEQISLKLTFEELEQIDKYIELNEDTRQLFDKIRSAYPKSPVEAAYKRVFGEYPPTDPSVHNFDDNQWFAFQKGYSCGYGDGLENSNDFAISKVEETAQERGDRIHKEVENEIEKLQEKNWYVDAKTLLKSKKPVEKQSKTLTDVVYRWWEEVFTTHSDWNMETSIADLIDQVEQFLPKQKFGSSQNVLGDVDIVEGFNDAIKKIKGKLR